MHSIEFTAAQLFQTSDGSLVHFAERGGCRLELKLKRTIPPETIESCTIYFEPDADLPTNGELWLDAAIEDLREIAAMSLEPSLTSLYDLSDSQVIEILNSALLDLHRQRLH